LRLPSPAADDAAFDALGSPVRRTIIRLLSERPRAVGELAQQLPVSRPAVSKHLRLLENAGLVAAQAQGNRNLYRLEARGFEAARGFLDAFWNEAVARFALAAENTHDAGPEPDDA
jgi:DNA-binding transcriptional ArsR family regulator